VQRGINEHTLLDLVEHFKDKDYIVRFLEYMDVGNRNHWDRRLVVPSREIIEKIHEKFPLKAVAPNYTGEVASRYQFADGTGEVGFISSISQPFCSDCTRARLSPEGKFYTCLFASDGIDLRTPLRSGTNDGQLLDLISRTWRKREDRYSELRDSRLVKTETYKKIEMYQIGG
jgi:cyclic pyranopterin phosphate synthase